MKKIVISVAVAAAVVFGVFQANNNNNLSELQMENVEALADGEDGETPKIVCINSSNECYKIIIYPSQPAMPIQTSIVYGDRFLK